MDDHQLLTGLVAAVVAAFAGGLVAQRLGQPVIVGYLLAGVALGPFTPGPSVRGGSIDVLAEIGVAFLMFAVGTEFSREEFTRFRKVIVWGGLAELVGMIACGPLLAPLLGANLNQGIFLGALLALSSTVVALKILMAAASCTACTAALPSACSLPRTSRGPAACPAARAHLRRHP